MVSTLRDAGYNLQTNVVVGRSPDGSQFRAKIAASYGEGPALILSGHSQRRRGTTENKIPWEAISISSAIDSSKDRYSRGYIVLAGSGWTLKDFFVRGGLEQYMKGVDLVKIITLDDFMERVQTRTL